MTLFLMAGLLWTCPSYGTNAERFDTVENKWEEIANMQQERQCAFGVATEGKIFLAGGMRQEFSWLKTCEMHNISTNEWQFIGSLNAVHSYGSMVCLKGTLYVLGGTFDDHLNVECYDPQRTSGSRRQLYQ